MKNDMGSNRADKQRPSTPKALNNQVDTSVVEFFNPSYGKPRFGQFPLDKYMIGMEFEVGGAYEDWGWIMYEKIPKTNQYKTFCSARNLKDLIAKADTQVNDLVAPKPLASTDVANPPNTASINEILEDHLYAIWSADDMDRGEFEYRSRQIKTALYTRHLYHERT